MSSLHVTARLLICDGYSDPNMPQLVLAKVDQGHELHGYSVPDAPQLVPTKVDQGHELHGYSEPSAPRLVSAKVNQGLEPKVSQGRELQFQGRALVAGKVNEGREAVVQGRDVAPDSGGQGHGPAVQGHEMPSDNVSQGQGRVFQGHVKVDGLSEVNADERWRERARQRRLARYFSTYCYFDWLICVTK